jgi:ribonuclease-3 family protein
MLQALSDTEIGRLSSATLAYLGDSVFETYARQRLMWPPLRHRDLVDLVRTFSCAEGQSAGLKRLRDSGFVFSEEEEAWLRRGRNSAGKGPKHAAPREYRDASSLECLLGFLHLTDSRRCEEILDLIIGAPEGASEDAAVHVAASD